MWHFSWYLNPDWTIQCTGDPIWCNVLKVAFSAEIASVTRSSNDTANLQQVFLWTSLETLLSPRHCVEKQTSLRKWQIWWIFLAWSRISIVSSNTCHLCSNLELLHGGWCGGRWAGFPCYPSAIEHVRQETEHLSLLPSTTLRWWGLKEFLHWLSCGSEKKPVQEFAVKQWQ